MDDGALTRPALVAEAFSLEWMTVGWMTIEAAVALWSGLAARSLTLVAFGFDSSAKDNDEAAPRQIGRVSMSTALAGSGTSLTFSGASLARNTAGESFPTFLLQLPGATRGGNGRIDVNGQRSGVGFIVDGVPISQSSSRNLGANVDADNLAGFATSDGAYPASVGGTFGAVVTIATTPATGPPRASYELTAGDARYVQPEAAYHAPLGALDPPTFRAEHDAGSVANGFLRGNVPVGTSDLVDVIASASLVARRIAAMLLELTITNVFNDRYLLTAGESDGIHANHPRSVRLLVGFGG